MRHTVSLLGLVAIYATLAVFAAAARSPHLGNATSNTLLASTPFALDRPSDCPPCFNCMLPAFTCANSGECRQRDGQCDCPTGFGGQDCLSPLCDSPLKGEERSPREGDQCSCDDGWDGLNCNVCQTDEACSEFMLGGEKLLGNGTCYTGGSTIRQSFQQCDVTNKKITGMLPGRPPKVTFSCEKDDAACNFQVSKKGAP